MVCIPVSGCPTCARVCSLDRGGPGPPTVGLGWWSAGVGRPTTRPGSGGSAGFGGHRQSPASPSDPLAEPAARSVPASRSWLRIDRCAGAVALATRIEADATRAGETEGRTLARPQVAVIASTVSPLPSRRPETMTETEHPDLVATVIRLTRLAETDLDQAQRRFDVLVARYGRARMGHALATALTRDPALAP